jgi:hypothetical protein
MHNKTGENVCYKYHYELVVTSKQLMVSCAYSSHRPHIWLVVGVWSTGTTPGAATAQAQPIEDMGGIPLCSHGQKEMESSMVPRSDHQRGEHGRHTRGQHRTTQTTPAFVSTGQAGPLTVAFDPIPHPITDGKPDRPARLLVCPTDAQCTSTDGGLPPCVPTEQFSPARRVAPATAAGTSPAAGQYADVPRRSWVGAAWPRPAPCRPAAHRALFIAASGAGPCFPSRGRAAA